ncbi:MAG: ATP-binding protein [Gemmatimonadota bacterium]|nr:ATP-binding protein [Gemmatimonadota bacterium]
MADELVMLVSALAQSGDRTERAAELARLFGADALLVFICDEELGVFLSAPGFRQTLPNGRAWRTFLAETEKHGTCTAMLPFVSASLAVPAVGYSNHPDHVVVLLGVESPNADVSGLLSLMPLLVGVLKSERKLQLATLHARTATDAVDKSRVIAATLERTRNQLENALRSAHEARMEVERTNAELARHASELELANEQLHNQADELEAQAMEMELQATQLQTSNAELVQSREAAEAANRTKGDFLATMSHELRTPLNAIGGYADLIAMGIHGPVTEAQRDALDRVVRSQRHLLRLINDILNLSRLEAGAIGYTMSVVSLADAVADLAPMIDPQIEAKSLSFEIRDAARLPTVYADSERLQQILLNLLSNSVKFTPPGGSIWIEAWERADSAGSPRVDVCVGDTGDGIPSQKLDWIFEPFTQVDASHSRVSQGAGLGLAISRDLARGMGGDLSASSEVGVGSIFTLTLQCRSA